MTDAYRQWLPQLLALPADERIMLARELLSSVDDEDEGSDEFLAELIRRSDEAKRDPTTSRPAREVLEELRKNLREAASH